jgi:acyl carrier protein
VTELGDEILAEIRRIFATQLDRPGPVEPHHALAGDLELDSMGALVLAVGLEDRFRVRLDGADAGSVVSVADLVALVERALAAGGGEDLPGETGGPAG